MTKQSRFEKGGLPPYREINPLAEKGAFLDVILTLILSGDEEVREGSIKPLKIRAIAPFVLYIFTIFANKDSSLCSE